MPLRRHIFLTLLSTLLLLSHASRLSRRQTPAHNDFACRSRMHPNPIVILHGFLAAYSEDTDQLEGYLQSQGFCTFSFTYGETIPGLPIPSGGTISIHDSSATIASFIQQVLSLTGAYYVDLVGHSEGAFQALYVPKFYPSLAHRIENVFAIAPPTHGTTLSGIYNLAYIGGQASRRLIGGLLDTIGCGAWDDLGPEGPAVQMLNDGPIAQPGIRYTILTSTHDELITPPETAFVYEPGVVNLYIQQFCPQNIVGHVAEAYDPNVMAVVANTLRGQISGPAQCVTGPSLAKGIASGLEKITSGKQPVVQGALSAVNEVLGSLGVLRKGKRPIEPMGSLRACPFENEHFSA